MKRFISFTLALVLCFSLSIPALAAIDVSSMSINELNELLGEIENQILKKGGDVQIPDGTYFGGTDIAAGSYDFKAVNADLVTYFIYPKGDKPMSADYIDSDSYTRITINEGDKFMITDPCYMRKAAKFGFF